MKGVDYMPMDFDVNVKVRTTGAEKIDALEAKIKSLKTQPINLKVNVDNKSLNVTSLGTQLQGSFANAGTSAGKAYNTALQTQINAMAKTQHTAFSQPLRNITKQQQSYINWWEKSLNKFSQLDATTASNKTLTWLKNNSKAAKDYGAVLTDLANKQRYATSAEELKSYTKQIQAIQAQAAALGKTGRSFADEIGRGFKKIGQFALTYGIIQRLAYQVPRAISQAVISIDDSVTQLKKVSDATDLQISSYFDEAAASAKKYGQTISDVIATTADWSRLGYSLEDSKLLSDITTLYQNVGDNMTQESASSSMISTLQGFQMQADEAMHIVDTYNEVGNKFAIGSDGIGEALQRSASSMYAANNSFEQTVGLVTAANTVVQDPDSVGIYVPTLKIAITVKLLGRTRPWKDHSIYNNLLKLNQGDLKIA